MIKEEIEDATQYQPIMEESRTVYREMRSNIKVGGVIASKSLFLLPRVRDAWWRRGPRAGGGVW